MTASYPGTVKVWTTKVDLIDIDYAAHINDMQAEIAALQTVLGTDPHAGFSTVRDRIAALESGKAAAVHTHDITTLTNLTADFATQYLTTGRHDDPALHQFGSGHALGNPGTPQPTNNSAGAVGTSNVPARSDHVHLDPYAGVAGPTGPAGPTGATGPQGPQGPSAIYGAGTYTGNDTLNRFINVGVTPKLVIITRGNLSNPGLFAISNFVPGGAGWSSDGSVTTSDVADITTNGFIVGNGDHHPLNDAPNVYQYLVFA